MTEKMVIWVKATVDVISHGETQKGIMMKDQESFLSKFIDIDKSWNAEQVGNAIAKSIEADLEIGEENVGIQFLWAIADIKVINN